MEIMNLIIFFTNIIKPCSSTLLKLNLHFSSFDMYFHSKHEIPKNEKFIKVLFDCLELSTIIKLWICILHEKHIILISNSNLLLYTVTNALLGLIFPFKWLHTFISLIPNELFDILDCPTPYIMGVSSLKTDFFSLKEMYPQYVICDLNTSQIHCPVIVKLPENEDFKLRKKINYIKNQNLINLDNIFTNGYFIDSIQAQSYENNNRKTILNSNKNVNFNFGSSSNVNNTYNSTQQNNLNDLKVFSKQFKDKKTVSTSFFIFEDVSDYRSFSENIQNIFFRILRSPLENFEVKFLKNNEFDSNLFLDSFSSDEYRDFWNKIITTSAFEYFILSNRYLDFSNTHIFKGIVENETNEVYLSEVYNLNLNIPLSMTNIFCDLENKAKANSESFSVSFNLNVDDYVSKCKKSSKEYNTVMSEKSKYLKDNEMKYKKKVNFQRLVNQKKKTYDISKYGTNSSFHKSKISNLQTLFEDKEETTKKNEENEDESNNKETTKSEKLYIIKSIHDIDEEEGCYEKEKEIDIEISEEKSNNIDEFFYGDNGFIDYISYILQFSHIFKTNEFGFSNDIIAEINKHKDFRKVVPYENSPIQRKVNSLKVQGQDMLNLDQSCSKIEEETDEVDNDIHDSVLEISFNNCRSLRMSLEKPVSNHYFIDLPKVDCFQYYQTLAYYMQEYCSKKITQIFELYIKSAEKSIINFPFVFFNQFIEGLDLIEVSSLIKILYSSNIISDNSKQFKEMITSTENKLKRTLKTIKNETTMNINSVYNKNRYSFILNILLLRKDKLKSNEKKKKSSKIRNNPDSNKNSSNLINLSSRNNSSALEMNQLPCNSPKINKTSPNKVKILNNPSLNKVSKEMLGCSNKDDSSSDEDETEYINEKMEAFEGTANAEKILENLKIYNASSDNLMKKNIINITNYTSENKSNLTLDCISLVEDICSNINNIIIKSSLDKYKLESNNYIILNEISQSEQFLGIKKLVSQLSAVNLDLIIGQDLYNDSKSNTIILKNESSQLSQRQINRKNSLYSNIKICFWLNIFNYLTVFTVFLKKEFISSFFEWNKFLKNSYFNIGGIVLSLYEIDSFILKDLNEKTKFTDNFIKIINHPEQSLYVTINHSNKPKFLNYGICLPTKSSPSLRIFFPNNLTEKLKANAYDFLTNGINIEIDKSTIFIPEYLNHIDENFKGNINNYNDLLPKIFMKYVQHYQLQVTKGDWRLNFSYYKSIETNFS